MDSMPASATTTLPGAEVTQSLRAAEHAMAAGDYDRAKSLGTVQYAECEDHPALRSRVAALLAKVCWNMSTGDEGLKWAESALAEAVRAGDPILEAEAWGVKGSCHALLEQGGPAILALERALTCLPASAPELVQLNVFTGVGLSYHELGLPVSAIPPLRRALEMARNGPSPGRALRVGVNLMSAAVAAWHLLESTEPGQAKDILDETVALLPWLQAQTTLVDSKHAGFAYRDTAAQVLAASGDLAQARDLLQQCLQLGKDVAWQHRRDWAIDLAGIEHSLGNREGAGVHAVLARRLIDEHPTERLSPEDMRRRAGLAALEGDAHGALAWHRRFHARVVRNEQSALEAKVAELSLLVSQQSLRMEVADLREQQAGLADRYQQMQVLARSDPLTGLLNRRAFESEFASLKQQPTHLGLFDLDHFKRVNDEFGHLVGDEVLREVARLMLGVLRDRDRLCRYGGEEFAILLVEGGAKGAELVARRLLRAVEGHDWQRVQADLVVTLSGGVVAVPAGTDLIQAVLQADALLYRAKFEGRNRVCLDAADATDPA